MFSSFSDEESVEPTSLLSPPKSKACDEAVQPRNVISTLISVLQRQAISREIFSSKLKQLYKVPWHEDFRKSQSSFLIITFNTPTQLHPFQISPKISFSRHYISIFTNTEKGIYGFFETISTTMTYQVHDSIYFFK